MKISPERSLEKIDRNILKRVLDSDITADLITFLKKAMESKDYEAVSLLMLPLVTKIDAKSYGEFLQSAIDAGEIKILEQLLHSDVLQRLEDEVLPFHMLCKAKQDYALLIERFCHGLKLSLADADGNTPMHLAVMHGHKHTVGKIAHSADLNCKNTLDLKPIQLAAERGSFEIVKTLYYAGGDVSSCIKIVRNRGDDSDAKTRFLEQLTNLASNNKLQKLAMAANAANDNNAKDDDAKKTKYIYGCFKGGGIKGLAYLDALKEAIRLGLIDLKDFKGFAGTSAGSITAALLALNIPIEQLEGIIKNKNFTDFFDYYNPDLVKSALEKFEQYKKDGLGFMSAISAYYLGKDAKVLLDKNLGVCKGDNFLEWIRERIGDGCKSNICKMPKDVQDDPTKANPHTIYLTVDGSYLVKDLNNNVKTGKIADLGLTEQNIAEKLNEKDIRNKILDEVVKAGHTTRTSLSWKIPAHITFRDLHDSGLFKELVVYGANVNTGFPERYSYETTPDMCVADAIRISMSIPILFSPHQKYIMKDGVRQLAKKTVQKDGVDKLVDDEDICVDGGLFYNYPAGAFDYDPITGAYKYNEQTIGFCLTEPEDHAQLEHERERVGLPLPKDSVISYCISLVYSTMFNQQTHDHLKSMDRNRTIYINTKDIQTTEFDLTKERQEILSYEAIQGVINFIARQHNLPEKELCSEVVKKLFSLGILCKENGIVRRGSIKELTVSRIVKLYASAPEEDLPYLKMLVNPNFTENGVTALQVAKAYGYAEVEKRLLKCNANSDVDALSLEEIRQKISIDKLIVGFDEKKLMQPKKVRLLAATKQLQKDHEDLQRQFRKEHGQILEEHAQEKANLQNEINSLREQLAQQSEFFRNRILYETKLRQKIEDLNAFKLNYFVNNSGFLKKSGRENAEQHWSCWFQIYAKDILQFFLSKLPEDEVKSAEQVKEIYIDSLNYLLKMLRSGDMQKLIQDSGENSYRESVEDYATHINDHLQSLRPAHAPNFFAPAAAPSRQSQVLQATTSSDPTRTWLNSNHN